MRCLVTGASGHVGAALTRFLVGRGDDVTILVRPPSDLWRLTGLLDQVRVRRAEFTDPRAIGTALADARPEVVFHLGWSGVTRAQRDAPEQITVNVPGTLALFQHARAAGCTTWVAVGSQAEYGPVDGVLTEDTCTRPSSTYGLAKLCTGQLVTGLAATVGARCAWVRLLATYGPADDEQHLIPSTLRCLLRGERPALTAGTQRWDYLYVDDAAAALRALAVTPDAGGVFVLASGVSHPVREVVERLRDLVDPGLAIGFGDVPSDPGAPQHLEGDASRLRRITGWRATTSLEDGLRRTIRWYRDHSPRLVEY